MARRKAGGKSIRFLSSQVLMGMKDYLLLTSFPIATLMSLLVLLSYISELRGVLLLILGFISFALPGILIILHIARKFPSLYELEDILIIGSVLGISITSTLAATLSSIIGFTSLYIIVGWLFITSFLVVSPNFLKYPYSRLKRMTNSHRNLLCIFIVLIAMTLVIPYRSFGHLTPTGMAFNGLHKTDLLHHMSTAIELTKGIPPQNPYFSGEILHYYWLSHVFPAFLYSLSSYVIQPRDIIVLTSMLYSILFICSLFCTLRLFNLHMRTISLVMLLSLLAYGYNYLFVIAKLAVHSMRDVPIGELLWGYFFVDDWNQEYTGYSHGWFRSFLVEPQVTLALSLLLCVTFIWSKHGVFPGGGGVAVLQGWLMGSTLGVDSFLGSMFVICFSILSVWRTYREGLSWNVTRTIGVVGGVALGWVLLLLSLQMVEMGSGPLLVRPYTTMLTVAPLYFIIDYGPGCIVALIGMAALWRQKKEVQEILHFFAILTVVCLFMMFLVQYRDVGTLAFRKGGMMVRLAVVIFSAIGLEWLMVRSSEKRMLCAVLLGLIVVGIPNPFVDAYRISTFDKRDEETYYVGNEDLEAYGWMKRNLAKDAIVQEMPAGVSGIVAFAERRTALGDWEHAKGYQIGTERVVERHRDIYRTLFHGRGIDGAVKVMKKYAIQYIYIGAGAEREIDAGGLEKFERFPEIFEKIYCRAGVRIYRFVSFE